MEQAVGIELNLINHLSVFIVERSCRNWTINILSLWLCQWCHGC